MKQTYQMSGKKRAHAHAQARLLCIIYSIYSIYYIYLLYICRKSIAVVAAGNAPQF